MVLGFWGVDIQAAEVVTRCGTSEGYSYFIEGGAVPRGKGGWQQDKTSDASYLLLRDRERNSFDLIFTDSTKRTISSSEDGGNVVLVSESTSILVLIINYPNKLLETWVFDIDPTGVGTVTFHQARYGNYPVRKHAVMRAACRR